MASSDEENDFGSDDSDDEEEDDTRKRKADGGNGSSKKKKKRVASLIDDSAVHSGDEENPDDDDDDEDDEEGEDNDYVRDDFVVDDADEEDDDGPRGRRGRGGGGGGDLEDSDDDDDDDDESDDSEDGRRKAQRNKMKKHKKFRKLKQNLALDDDDLDLIAESHGHKRERSVRAEGVRAKDAASLRRGLFGGEEEEEEEEARRAAPKGARGRRREDYYVDVDEDDMDNFIDDDLEDLDDDGRDGQRGRGRRPARDYAEDDDGDDGPNEGQLQQAVDIFGTDYLEHMPRSDGKDAGFREEGVGVDLGVGEDDYISDNDELDENNLFHPDDDDEDGDGLSAEQRRKRAKEARERRRRKELERRNARRKARLRRAFEPAHLAENFCTERDDRIRRTDEPERFFERKTPYHADTLEEEALWIATRVPNIARRYKRPVDDDERLNPTANADEEDEEAFADPTERKNKGIVESIAKALKLMHEDKLEPEFIRRYRADIVTDPVVRDSLYEVMDMDVKYDRMVFDRRRVEKMLNKMSAAPKKKEDSVAATLRNDLKLAQERLEDSLKDEEKTKEALREVDVSVANLQTDRKDKGDDDNDDDDDNELFGKDDDDDEEKQVKLDEKKKEKERLEEHLTTIQALVQERADRVATLDMAVKANSGGDEDEDDDDPANEEADAKRCLPFLFNAKNYVGLLSSTDDPRDLSDLAAYLSLIREGSDAVSAGDGGGEEDAAAARTRTRRRRTDYYRTCVGEGLRRVVYKFVLSPFKVGVKLEKTTTGDGVFDYSAPVEEGDEDVDPSRWCPPSMEEDDPVEFAQLAVNSGELASRDDAVNEPDPLKGCRYVAAMELAQEPRVRRCLRRMYRQRAVLTTRPTARGMHEVHPFHEQYGLHLIKEKPVHEHFGSKDNPMVDREDMRPDEREMLEDELRRLESESCDQYLRIMKAEKAGNVSTKIHLPYVLPPESSMTENERRALVDDWYKPNKKSSSLEPKQDLTPFFDALERVFLTPNGDESEGWANERRRIVRSAVVNFSLPLFESELRRDLREAAFAAGETRASEALSRMAMEGPYRPNHLFGKNRFLVPTGDLPMVGVCVADDGQRDPTYLAAVDRRGVVADNLVLPGGSDFAASKEDVIKFLMRARPAAVLVGTGGHRASKAVARRLGECVTEATERWNNRHIQKLDEDDEAYDTRIRKLDDEDNDDYEDVEWRSNVDLVDDNVSQLFGRSRVRGEREFPEFHTNLRCAISIARHAQDPLAELCYAWSVVSDAGTFGSELLHLNVHPAQRSIPVHRLLRGYERTLCKAVAAVGVDLNAACTHKHLHGTLQFVPGLGPRKALALKQRVARAGGAVAGRRDLLEKRLVGPTVYNNSVAFLRIREKDMLEGQLVHPLDDTRLHPDVYHKCKWASKMAMDALDVQNRNENSEGVDITAVKDVMADSQEEVRRLSEAVKAEYESANRVAFISYDWDPRSLPENAWHDKVGLLDLEMFAKMIENQYGMGKWLSHLIMIVWEFRLPFEDPRKPMEPLSGDKKFRLLTGEDDLTLCPGKEVTGRVHRIHDYGCSVRLDCDVDGDIPLRNLADGQVESVQEVVSQNTIVTALITDVKKDDYMKVELTLKQSDFDRPASDWPRPESLPDLDKRFDRAAANRIEKERKAKTDARIKALQNVNRGPSDAKGARGSRVSRRACTHPAFRNYKQNEIDNELRAAGESMVGQALIRPSGSKADALVVHWVVRMGSVKIIEVLESGKDTDASIGSVLKIKDEEYGTIDELIGRHVEPMNSFVEEITKHRKFQNMNEDRVDEKLKAEKKKTPNSFHYFLCWSKYPGVFYLRFIRTVNVRYHRIDVSPNGFVWILNSGNKCYDSIDRMIMAFKKNPTGEQILHHKPPPTAGEPKRRWTTKLSESIGRPTGWGAPPPPSRKPPPPAAQGWRPAPPPTLPPVPAGVPTAGHPPPPPGPPPPGPPPSFPPPSGFPPAFQHPPPPGIPPPTGGYPPTHGSVQS